MRKSIESYEHYFNVDELNKDIKLINDLIKKYNKNTVQINIKHSGQATEKDQLFYCADSMFNRDTNKLLTTQDKFTNIIDIFKNTYTAEVINKVTAIAAADNISIGRARYMGLNGKSTLTYHRDPDSIVRYHIPVVTSDSAFFIVENELFQMNTPGRLYDIIPTRRHTAINASRDTRWHLVLDGYIKLDSHDFLNTLQQHQH